jgi:hypothetical protein
MEPDLVQLYWFRNEYRPGTVEAVQPHCGLDVGAVGDELGFVGNLGIHYETVIAMQGVYGRRQFSRGSGRVSATSTTSRSERGLARPAAWEPYASAYASLGSVKSENNRAAAVSKAGVVAVMISPGAVR